MTWPHVRWLGATLTSDVCAGLRPYAQGLGNLHSWAHPKLFFSEICDRAASEVYEVATLQTSSYPEVLPLGPLQYTLAF